MKLKADIVNDDLLPRANYIANVLWSKEFAAAVAERVLGPHLKSRELGPAEFYIQECDLAVSASPAAGIEARLSGISGPTVATRRSIDDYPNALRELTTLYRETIGSLLPIGSRCQLFVALMTDTPVEFRGKLTTLLEDDPKWIEGRGDAEKTING